MDQVSIYPTVRVTSTTQRDSCIKAAEKMIGEGTSVAIGKRMHALRWVVARMHDLTMEHTDNTNADRETRAHWTALAKRLELPIRCVMFTASSELCEHNNMVRALNVGPYVSTQQ
jgi:bifunctional polynucleotide phosphatase/kinase